VNKLVSESVILTLRKTSNEIRTNTSSTVLR